MPRYDKQRFQVGDYWLSQQSRSPAWCRTWYDPQSEQTRRVSLRTADFEQAKQRLTDWFILEHQQKGQTTDDVTLASLFARYFEKHARNLKSGSDYKTLLGYWLDFHGASTLAEAADLGQQERFRDWLSEEKQLSPSSIRTTITVGKAAFNWAFKRGEIDKVPYFELVKVPPQKPKGRHRVIDEIAKLLTASRNRHVKLFLLMLIGTAARPRAIYDLRFEQIDFKLDLIDLNPKGYVPSKNKIRPIVKLPAELKPVLLDQQQRYKTNALISYDGEPIKSLRTAWRKLRIRAGFDQDVMLYSFRRTMARNLRIKGVPAWEVAEQLGHRTGYQVTELYTSHSPDYLSKAVKAIDDFFGELTCELRVKNYSKFWEMNSAPTRCQELLIKSIKTITYKNFRVQLLPKKLR